MVSIHCFGSLGSLFGHILVTFWYTDVTSALHQRCISVASALHQRCISVAPENTFFTRQIASEWDPKGTQNRLIIREDAPQGPSKEGLETQSGKNCLPEPPSDLLRCLPYGPCHGFYTSQRVSPSSLWALFRLRFGSISATLGTQTSPKERKKRLQKRDRKRTSKRCLKVPRKCPIRQK
jgi:hypothetical protein